MTAARTLTLLGSEAIADGTTTFHFVRPAGFAFRPGQYMNLSLVAPREADPSGNLRSFSIASAPHEAELTFATRMRGSPFKRELAALPAGAQVMAEGPFGELVLDDDARDAVLLAGGIGITPFRSMLRDAAHRGSVRNITLVYGNRTPQSSAFLDELSALSDALPRLRMVNCVSEPERCVPAWQGETGFVTEKLLARYVANPRTAIWYVVGPPAMTAAMRDTLLNLDVDDEAVRVEEFAGY